MTHPNGGAGTGSSGGAGTSPRVKTTSIEKLEAKITASDGGGVLARWRYGQKLLEAKAGRKQLPDGMIADLIKAAARAGKTISEREIQYRLKLASVYATDQQVRKAIADLGTWTEIIKAGFPPVELDEPEDLEAAGISTAAPDSWEQLSIVPGLGETLKVGGRTIRLAEATVADVKAYRDKYAEVHANFAKRLALIENALRIMADATDDPDANALDAWRRGLSEDTP